MSSRQCPTCDDKDYSDPCPLGWRTNIAENACEASFTYEGLCRHNLGFGKRSVSEKLELEIACSVCWPCKEPDANTSGSCNRDWVQPCPNGYLPVGLPWDAFADARQVCAATAAYDGSCEPEVSFVGKLEKEEFATSCATSWPCEESCANSLKLSLCPTTWLHVGKGVCVAPTHYRKHGCPLAAKFHGWTAGMKKRFADECDVVWSCSDASYFPTSIDNIAIMCRSIDVSACPVDWIRQDEQKCAPPIDYTGPCAVPMDFNTFSFEEKLHWTSKCVTVEWPCNGVTVSDVSVTTPSSNGVVNRFASRVHT